MLKKLLSLRLVETPRQLEGMTRFRYEQLKHLVKGKRVLELGSGLGQGANLIK